MSGTRLDGGARNSTRLDGDRFSRAGLASGGRSFGSSISTGGTRLLSLGLTNITFGILHNDLHIVDALSFITAEVGQSIGLIRRETAWDADDVQPLR